MTEITEAAQRATILVIDDTPDNLVLMGDVLMDEYKVKAANNGEKGLRIARSGHPPDLILLDIMMPGMDGYEVCRQLKADEATREIPVIFVTALTETADEKQGLELGAVDYITKPISTPIMLARVRNHLELKKHRDRLSELVAQRTRELEAACNRLKALDEGSRDYLRSISHELRTPANGVLGICELALDDMADAALKVNYKHLFAASRERMITSIEAALQLAELQSGCSSVATVPLDLPALLATLETGNASLSLPDGPATVLGNEIFLRRSLTTMFRAARQLADPGTGLATAITECDDKLVLKIAFQSKAVTDALEQTFFDIFSYARSCSYIESLGLAMPLAAELIKAMGGTVEIRKSGSGVEIDLGLLKVCD